jgi:hypothetical protein
MKIFAWIAPALGLALGCGTKIEQKHPGEMFEPGTGLTSFHAGNLRWVGYPFQS